MTITLWHGLTSADGKYMEKLMQRYCTEKNPNIKLEANTIAWGDMYAKLPTAYMSKTLPTFYVLHLEVVPQFAGNVLQPIDDLIGPLKLKERLVPECYKITKYEDKTYIVPMTTVTGCNFFWKKDLIDLGYDPAFPPETYEEMTQFGKRATRGEGANKIWGHEIEYNVGVAWNAGLNLQEVLSLTKIEQKQPLIPMLDSKH